MNQISKLLEDFGYSVVNKNEDSRASLRQPVENKLYELIMQEKPLTTVDAPVNVWKDRIDRLFGKSGGK